MAKKERGLTIIGPGKALLTGALAAASLASPAAGVQVVDAGSAKTISVRDSAIEAQVAPKPVTDNKKLLNGRIKRHYGAESRFLNQRQYRKKCRQNPSLYKSKKHRSNN